MCLDATGVLKSQHSCVCARLSTSYKHYSWCLPAFLYTSIIVIIVTILLLSLLFLLLEIIPIPFHTFLTLIYCLAVVSWIPLSPHRLHHPVSESILCSNNNRHCPSQLLHFLLSFPFLCWPSLYHSYYLSLSSNISFSLFQFSFFVFVFYFFHLGISINYLHILQLSSL